MSRKHGIGAKFVQIVAIIAKIYDLYKNFFSVLTAKMGLAEKYCNMTYIIENADILKVIHSIKKNLVFLNIERCVSLNKKK